MKRLRVSLLVCFVAAAGSAAPGAAELSPSAALKDSGIKGGLVVHLGCGDGKATAGLRTGESYIVHGLDRGAENVAAARDYFSRKGVFVPVSDGMIAARSQLYLSTTNGKVLCMGAAEQEK